MHHKRQLFESGVALRKCFCTHIILCSSKANAVSPVYSCISTPAFDIDLYFSSLSQETGTLTSFVQFVLETPRLQDSSTTPHH